MSLNDNRLTFFATLGRARPRSDDPTCPGLPWMHPMHRRTDDRKDLTGVVELRKCYGGQSTQGPKVPSPERMSTSDTLNAWDDSEQFFTKSIQIRCDFTCRIRNVKAGSRRTSLGRNLWNSLLAPRSLVWLVLGVPCCLVPAIGHSQDLPVVEAPGPATPSDHASADPRPAGSISGTVLDGSGAVVVGARVTLTRADQSASQEAISGDRGEFSFVNVAPGSFQIQVTAKGFAAQTSSGILHVGEVYLAPPIALVPSTVDTEVLVTVPGSQVAEEQIKAQEQQRVLGVVPNFYVSYIANAAPLNAKQKFELAWRSTFDPVTFAFTVGTAGVEQAQNAFGGYGQGAQGYGKRFGALYADNITSTFIGSALLPAVLKQDPRYFYKGTGSTSSRILYAIANSVICKGDNRRWQPNYSAILGGLASGTISNLYYPPGSRGTALVFENTLIGTGETAVMNVFQEFVIRKVTPHVPNTNLSGSSASQSKLAH
jgi:hypothetical protein